MCVCVSVRAGIYFSGHVLSVLLVDIGFYVGMEKSHIFFHFVPFSFSVSVGVGRFGYLGTDHTSH